MSNQKIRYMKKYIPPIIPQSLSFYSGALHLISKNKNWKKLTDSLAIYVKSTLRDEVDDIKRMYLILDWLKKNLDSSLDFADVNKAYNESLNSNK